MRHQSSILKISGVKRSCKCEEKVITKLIKLSPEKLKKSLNKTRAGTGASRLGNQSALNSFLISPSSDKNTARTSLRLFAPDVRLGALVVNETVFVTRRARLVSFIYFDVLNRTRCITRILGRCVATQRLAPQIVNRRRYYKDGNAQISVAFRVPAAFVNLYNSNPNVSSCLLSNRAAIVEYIRDRVAFTDLQQSSFTIPSGRQISVYGQILRDANAFYKNQVRACLSSIPAIGSETARILTANLSVTTTLTFNGTSDWIQRPI